MNNVLYIIMRNDMPSMNPGKLAAQASHISLAAQKEVNSTGSSIILDRWNMWAAETDQGFGPTICLGGTKEQIEDIWEKHQSPVYHVDFIMHKLYDPTYPSIVDKEIKNIFDEQETVDIEFIQREDGKFTMLRKELVGMLLFGDKTDDTFTSIFKHLELYP